MAKLTADQARDLANQYHDLAVAVGNYRFDNWDDLTPAQRKKLEDVQWTLMNYSSDFTSQAIALTVDDLQGSLDTISSATGQAAKAIAKIALVDKVLSIVATATLLAASIMSGNAQGALSAAGDLADAVAG